MKRDLGLLFSIVMVASFILAGAASAQYGIVFADSTNDFDGLLIPSQTTSGDVSEVPVAFDRVEKPAFASDVRRLVLWFEVTTAAIPVGATIGQVDLTIYSLYGYTPGGSVGVREIISGTGSASVDGLYKPNWRYLNTAREIEWASYTVSATDHFASAETSSELDTDINLTGVSTSMIFPDVSDATGIPAVMPAEGFKVAFMVYGKFTASSVVSHTWRGPGSGSQSPTLFVYYTLAGTPTPTATSTPSPTPTFTRTPTPGDTFTATPTPEISDEFGSRPDNQYVGIHGKLLVEEGLAAMDDGNTNLSAYREVLDRDGNFVGSLKNYIANPSFPSATTGWVANASMSWSWDAESIDDLDNSGSMLLTALAANAEASKGIDYKASHPTKVVWGAEVKGIQGQAVTLKIYSSSDSYSKVHTFLTNDWETAYLVADVTDGEDVEAVSVLISTPSYSLRVDNARFYHADVLFPMMPDYLEEGGALSASSLSLSGNLSVGGTTNLGAVSLTPPLGVDDGGTGTATAFTQGSVPFAGASGVYTQDNAGLFYDDGNDTLEAAKVEIDEYLEHNGDADTTLRFQTDRFTLSAGGVSMFDGHNTTQDLITIGAAADIDIGLNDDAFIQGSDGFLGLGTITPDYRLDVEGNAGFSEYLYHNGDADTFQRYQDDRWTLAAGGVTFIDAVETTQDIITVGAAADIDIALNDDVFIQGSDGFMGIGTTGPTAKLHIADPSANSDPTLRIQNDAKNWYMSVAGSSIDQFRWGESSDVFMSLYDGGSFGTLQVTGGLTANENGESGVNVRFESDTNVNMFYLDSPNNRIGIGTNTPSTLLDVEGNMTVDGNIISNGQLILQTNAVAVNSSVNDDIAVGDTAIVLLTTTVGSTITITSIAGGVDGRVLKLYNNDSANNMVLVDNAATGTAANRFELNANYTIGTYEGVTVFYDGASSRWKLLQEN